MVRTFYCENCEDDVTGIYRGAGEWKCPECSNLLPPDDAFYRTFQDTTPTLMVQLRGEKEIIYGVCLAHDAIGISLTEVRQRNLALETDTWELDMFIPWSSIAYTREMRQGEEPDAFKPSETSKPSDILSAPPEAAQDFQAYTFQEWEMDFITGDDDLDDESK